METYNRIMEKFWLVAGIAIFIYATVMGIQEGFDSWALWYIAAGISLFYWYMRRYMRKRMERFVDEHGEKLQKRKKDKS